MVTPTPWPASLASRLCLLAPPATAHHDVHVGGSLGRADKLRIAFASDFHAGPMTPQQCIDQAIDRLHQADADVLLLGGDFVGLRSECARELATRLATVRAPLGRFAVLGNHDYWADAAGVAGHLQRAGIEVLMNRNIRLPDPFGNVSICGVDDHTSGSPDVDGAFKGSEAVRIVLMHSPSSLLDIGARPFTVALCGHTHGGQIALPSGRPLLVAHGALTRRYNAGRFAIEGDRTLLVSRGVGYTAMPVRYNAPPEVLTCTLVGSRTE